jgi:ankyrin repeat protein
MNITINTSIPTCSNYFLFFDVPYRFSARHFSATFEQETSRPLTERTYHMVMGILLLFPPLNLIIAVIERILFPPFTSLPTVSNPPSSTKSVKTGKPPQKTVEEQIQTSVNQIETTWKKNPYVIANHKELRASNNPYQSHCTFDPFREAFLTRNETRVCEFIQNPYFKGLNTSHSIEHVIGSGAVITKHWPPLVMAAYLKNVPIFEMLLQNPATNLESCSLSNDVPSCLIAICELGAGHEAFIEKLIIKGAASRFKAGFDSEKSALDVARKSDISQETLMKLEAWHALNAVDVFGNTRLQQAINNLDLGEFKEALRQGISLNNRNNSGRTALHLAISKLSDLSGAKTAQEMLSLLLEKNVQLNIQDLSGHTPLLDVVLYKPSNWETLAISLLQKGADPDIGSNNNLVVWGQLSTYPSSHPVKAYLLNRPHGMHLYYQNQCTLATVLGSHIEIDIGRTGWSFADGGNFSEIIYDLLPDLIDPFLNSPNTSSGVQEMFSSIKETSSLAKKICFTTKIDEAIEEIQTAAHPVLIPSGWSGHAISLTLYKNQLICANVGSRPKTILGGLRYYQISDDLARQTDFAKLIQHSMQHKYFETGDKYYDRLEKLGCRYDTTLELCDQTIGNCTWASSALLGLRSALEIQKRWPSQDIAQAVEQFNQFAQSFLILKMVDYLKENISKLPISLAPSCLCACVTWLCQQLKADKDSWGYYKKALDALTFSGFTFSLDEELADFYASLYQISTDFLKKTLMKKKFQMGTWVAF